MFKGTGTALVTPFTQEGAIDWKSFSGLIDAQLKAGIDALVVCGTTGEPPTLSLVEQEQSVLFVLEQVAGRVPVIAGIGGNDTAEVVQTAETYSQLPLTGLLAVTPYYNKTTQSGLLAHYKAVADASDLPLMVYNVPGRTGMNLDPETMSRLADHPNITALKEASSSLAQMMQMFAQVGDRIAIYSGNDDQVFPLLALGGSGVVSVTSNLLPEEMRTITHTFFEGDHRASRDQQLALLPLISELFAQVSPIPVKAAMASRGMLENQLRLPLLPLTDEQSVPLLRVLDSMFPQS